MIQTDVDRGTLRCSLSDGKTRDTVQYKRLEERQRTSVVSMDNGNESRASDEGIQMQF